MNMPERIETARLSLRAATSEMLRDMRAAIEASLPELQPWMWWSVNEDEEGTAAFLRGAEKAREDQTSWAYAIFLDDELIGAVGLDRFDHMSNSCEIGYWIRSDRAGQGYMTEAASAAVGAAFDHLGVHRVELRAGYDNRGSIGVAQKLGFSEEGLLREAARGMHGYYDSLVFGLLETDSRPEVH